MKIESSSIYMNSATTQTKIAQTTEQMNAWVNNQPTASSQSGTVEENLANIKEVLESMKKSKSNNTAAVPIQIKQYKKEYSLSPEDDFKLRMLTSLLEALTGKKLKFHYPKRLVENAPANSVTYSQPLQNQSTAVSYGWGLDYQKHESYYESETMSFNSGGTAKTSDGKEIQFSIGLNMSRSFATENNISIKAGDALVDPLIINFDQPAASLTQKKFSFDIDNDGKTDSISFAKLGSGFLAFDKNNDGIINNGSELFGPNSGNGFVDLAQYDSDGNNWIDENDPIYDKLQIWTKDEKGNDQLFAIGEKD